MHEESDLLARAWALADHAHAGQTRRGKFAEPYIWHPVRVAKLVRSGGDDVVMAAALLHDVLEDTDVTASVIESEFGGIVAEIVLEVTRPAGMTSKAYWKHLLEAAPRMSHAARLIKVADAVDNVRDLARDPTIWGAKRVREYVEAKEALIKAIGEPWPDLVNLFEAEATKVRAYLSSLTERTTES